MSLPNTHYGSAIADLLKGRKKLWFIGIGGIHMASMALLAAQRGFAVAGSDRAAGDGTARLQRAGISVSYGHDAAHVVGADAVIYTLAVSPDNPEYTAARRLGIPLVSRADFLSFLMLDYTRQIAVSGSHGKSTVTAMLAEIFLAAGRDPTVICGAPLCRKGEPMLIGGGGDCLFEACEYQDSFHCFSPGLAVILNTEWDHVDYFPSLDAVKDSFAAFAARSRQVLVNAEDENALFCARTAGRPYRTFGIEKGDFHTRSWAFSDGRAKFFAVLPDGGMTPEISLRLAGRHNLSNAMAALGAAHLCGIPIDAIVTGLSVFGGAGRRLEYRGMIRGARMFDDYAHHPGEIAATLTAAREMVKKGRLFAVFQSHTYSRTAAFFTEICAALRLADRVLIADIYPARETDTLGMSAARLAAGVGERAAAPGSLQAIATTLLGELSPGDLTVVMGAGDIDRLFGEFSEKHFTL